MRKVLFFHKISNNNFKINNKIKNPQLKCLMLLCSRKIIFFQVILSNCTLKLRENRIIKINIVFKRIKNLILVEKNLIWQIIIYKIDSIIKLSRENNIKIFYYIYYKFIWNFI
jgi:hypothetical protein